MTLDHPVHRLDLLLHAGRHQRAIARLGIEHRQRLFQRMAEIGRVARARITMRALRFEHLVHLGRQRVEIGAIAHSHPVLLARMNALQAVVQPAQRAQTQAHLKIHARQQRCRQATQHHYQKPVDEHHVLARGRRPVDEQPEIVALDAQGRTRP